MASSDFSPGVPLDFASRLIPAVTVDVSHRPGETSPVPSSTFTASRSPYAGEFFSAAFPGSSHLPWPSLRMTSSALSCSLHRANISALQDSLYVAGYCFAPLSQGVTTLQHSQSPGCTGCLLRALLAVTPGLSLSKSRPDSHRLADDSFAGHTKRLLGCLVGTRANIAPLTSL
jgi:hypothetical protein